MEPFGDSLTFTTVNVVSLANEELDDGENGCQLLPTMRRPFSRPYSEWSIIKSEEIRKHCRLANIFIARCFSILKDVE